MVFTLIEITSISVQNFAVKPLACVSWFHLSFEHFDVVSIHGLRECRR